MTRQDKTRQDKTRQDKTRQDWVLVLTLVVWFCLTPNVYADPSHCDGNGINTSGDLDVYLNYDSFQYLYDSEGVLGGLTLDESVGALMQGLEEWNHSAAGRRLKYKGTTTHREGTCDFAVVRAGDYDSNGVFGQWITNVRAQIRHITCPGPSSFTVVFSSQNSSVQPLIKKWKTGDPALPGLDMITTMTHEFGHAVGIHHPDKANAFSVMEGGNPSRRELFQLDTECAELYYDGAPSTLNGSVFQFSGGGYSLASMGSSTLWATISGVTSGGSSGTPDRFRGVQMTSTGLYAEKYSTGLRYLNSATYHTSQPPLRVHRRDLPADYRDAIIVKRRNAVSYGDWNDEEFQHSIYAGPDGFETGYYHTTLSHCETISGATCTSFKNVHSNRRVAASFDTVSNKTVYVWTDQHRGDHSQNNKMLVSVRHHAWYLIGKPFDSGVRSDVAPAVACKAGAAGSNGRDCMVAYTDIADSKNSVRFRRFDVLFDGTSHYPSFEAGYHTVDSAGWPRTASPIGLFHHNGKWWLAIKLALATGNGGVRLYSSTTGNTGSWTSHGSTGHTLTGAGAIGDWTGSNFVRWTH